MKRLAWMLPVCALLSACTAAPSINVLGAYFPDWMFCIVGAVALTIIVHHALRAAGWTERLGPLPVAYPALGALFAMIGWLVLFQH